EVGGSSPPRPTHHDHPRPGHPGRADPVRAARPGSAASRAIAPSRATSRSAGPGRNSDCRPVSGSGRPAADRARKSAAEALALAGRTGPWTRIWRPASGQAPPQVSSP
ncbi:MAG: hypothetical protein ABJB47_07425, partial [Actinomycetota bacterium]